MEKRHVAPMVLLLVSILLLNMDIPTDEGSRPTQIIEACENDGEVSSKDVAPVVDGIEEREKTPTGPHDDAGEKVSRSDETATFRIVSNTSTFLKVTDMTQRVHLHETLSIRGYLAEDNNSDGELSSNEVYIPNAPLHVTYYGDTSVIWTNDNTRINPGWFYTAMINNDPNIGGVELLVEYLGEFLPLGVSTYNFLENNPTTREDHGLPGVDDDGDGEVDEELYDGLDNDNDGDVDEDLYMILARAPSSTLVRPELWHLSNMTIELNSTKVTVGEELGLHGRIIDETAPNTDMCGKVMEVLFDGVVIGTISNTLSNGYFHFEYVVPVSTSPGYHDLTVRFDSDISEANRYYEACSASVGPDVLRIYRPTKVVFTQGPEYRLCYRDTDRVINGTVLDAISNEPILFAIDDLSDFIYTVDLEWDQRGRKGYRIITDTLQEERNGNFSIAVHVPRVQDIGPVDVQATFHAQEETTFYRSSSGLADPPFTVRVHTAISLWIDQDGDGYSNEVGHGHDNGLEDLITREPMPEWPREVYGSNVLVVYGILWDVDLTTNHDEPSPISNGKVHLNWGMTEEDALPVGEIQTTGEDGMFRFVIDIDPSYELGPRFLEAIFYTSGYHQGAQWRSTDPGNERIFVIVSPVYFDIRSSAVIKGEKPTISGILEDDTGAPVANRSIDIFWQTTHFDVGFLINEVEGRHVPVITDDQGHFQFSGYTVPKTQPVGRAFVHARFYGTPDTDGDGLRDYAASEAYLNATSSVLEIDISSETALILVYSTDSDEEHPRPFVRDQSFTIKGQLLQMFQGRQLASYPVRESTVRVYLDDGRAHVLLGTLITNEDGLFLGTFRIPHVLAKGMLSLRLDFNGTTYFHPSLSVTQHPLFSRSSVQVISQPQFDPNDEDGDLVVDIFEWEMDRESTHYVQDLNYTFRIFEADTPENEPPRPIPYPVVWLNFSSLDSVFHNRTQVVGDLDGFVTFSFGSPLQDTDFPESTIEYHEDLEVNVSYIGTLYSLPTSRTLQAEYHTPSLGEDPESDGMLLFLIAIGIFICLSLILLYSLVYLRRQRRIHEMKRIIRRAADQLVAGNEYTAVIFKSYQKLSAHLRKHGFLRKEAETFREFEEAVRTALPIDSTSMAEFLDILEEARYSSHTMGESQRNRAIINLRRIESSLQQVIIDEEAAIRALVDLDDNDFRESDVVVKDDEKSKRKF